MECIALTFDLGVSILRYETLSALCCGAVNVIHGQDGCRKVVLLRRWRAHGDILLDCYYK